MGRSRAITRQSWYNYVNYVLSCGSLDAMPAELQAPRALEILEARDRALADPRTDPALVGLYRAVIDNGEPIEDYAAGQGIALRDAYRMRAGIIAIIARGAGYL